MSTRGEDPEKVRRWAREILAHPDRYAIVDTETTGLDDAAEIVQIAAIDPSGRVLLNSFVKPSVKRMPRRAYETHGIKISDLADAPTWSELTPELRRALQDRIVVAYNAEYDLRLARQTHAIRGGVDISGPWQCAMLAYAGYIGEPSRNHPGQYKWQKLPKGDHSAVGDCRATLEVIRTMAGRPPRKQIGCLILFGLVSLIVIIKICLTASEASQAPVPPMQPSSIRDAAVAPVDSGEDAGRRTRRRRITREAAPGDETGDPSGAPGVDAVQRTDK